MQRPYKRRYLRLNNMQEAFYGGKTTHYLCILKVATIFYTNSGLCQIIT